MDKDLHFCCLGLRRCVVFQFLASQTHQTFASIACNWPLVILMGPLQGLFLLYENDEFRMAAHLVIKIESLHVPCCISCGLAQWVNIQAVITAQAFFSSLSTCTQCFLSCSGSTKEAAAGVGEMQSSQHPVTWCCPARKRNWFVCCSWVSVWDFYYSVL